jgi:hypothetical protein
MQQLEPHVQFYVSAINYAIRADVSGQFAG